MGATCNYCSKNEENNNLNPYEHSKETLHSRFDSTIIPNNARANIDYENIFKNPSPTIDINSNELMCFEEKIKSLIKLSYYYKIRLIQSSIRKFLANKKFKQKEVLRFAESNKNSNYNIINISKDNVNNIKINNKLSSTSKTYDKDERKEVKFSLDGNYDNKDITEEEIIEEPIKTEASNNKNKVLKSKIKNSSKNLNNNSSQNSLSQVNKLPKNISFGNITNSGNLEALKSLEMNMNSDRSVIYSKRNNEPLKDEIVFVKNYINKGGKQSYTGYKYSLGGYHGIGGLKFKDNELFYGMLLSYKLIILTYF